MNSALRVGVSFTTNRCRRRAFLNLRGQVGRPLRTPECGGGWGGGVQPPGRRSLSVRGFNGADEEEERSSFRVSHSLAETVHPAATRAAPGPYPPPAARGERGWARAPSRPSPRGPAARAHWPAVRGAPPLTAVSQCMHGCQLVSRAGLVAASPSGGPGASSEER